MIFKNHCYMESAARFQALSVWKIGEKEYGCEEQIRGIFSLLYFLLLLYLEAQSWNIWNILTPKC